MPTNRREMLKSMSLTTLFAGGSAVALGAGPVFPPRPSFEVQPQSITFIPPHVGGDAEFAGHGPRVRTAVVLYVAPPNQIHALVCMEAMETKKDWTTASGWRSFPVVAGPRPITAMLSPACSFHQYKDVNWLEDIFHQAAPNGPTPGGPVKSLAYIGDTKGKEAGDRTCVRVTFNPVLVF